MINKTSIKDQVYEIIKSKILSNEYTFGDQINISNLCTELNVSNTPVREALSKLEIDGLVTYSMSKGAKIIDITDDLSTKINSIYYIMIRGALELCIKQNLVDELIILLKSAYAEQEKSYNHDKKSNYIEKAVCFDKQFITVLDNDQLTSMFDSLYPILFMLTNYQNDSNERSKETSLREHKLLIKYLSELNFNKVYDILFTHFDKHIPDIT